MKFADFQFTVTRHHVHYEENVNREVSPPEGENKIADNNESETPEANETDRPTGQILESKGQDTKDEEEGKRFSPLILRYSL